MQLQQAYASRVQPASYQRNLLLLWVAYTGYYLGRANLALALPVLVSGGYLSYATAGLITTLGYSTYAAGQPINGTLIDRFGAKRFLLLGLACSALLNLGFGFASTIALMAVIWAANGYFQACGWPALIKIADHWLPKEGRGKPMSLVSTSAHVGSILAWLLGTALIAAWGWRSVFWVPAGLLILVLAVNAPWLQERQPLAEPGHERASVSAPASALHSAEPTMRQVLRNPLVWQAALLLACTNLVLNSLAAWAPTFLTDHGVPLTYAGLQAIVFPTMGLVGALLTGWLFDHRSGDRRLWLLVPIYGGVSAGLLMLFANTPGSIAILAGLMLIGLCTAGANFIVTGLVPMHIATGSGQASTVGVIECAGYIGASIGTFCTGWLVELYSWPAALSLWLAATVLALLVSFVFCNQAPRADDK